MACGATIPVAKTYVDTWVDTNDLAVRTDYGFWYEPEKTMVWSSKQNDGQGHFVDYRMTEEFKGDTRDVHVLSARAREAESASAGEDRVHQGKDPTPAR